MQSQDRALQYTAMRRAVIKLKVMATKKAKHAFNLQIITSAEAGGYMFLVRSVCLSVRQITRKLVNGF